MAKAQIRNHVRRLREAQEITQTDLARGCGCTRQTIIMLEQERYVPSLSLAFTIARVLGKALEEVFEPVQTGE
ncbi:MAG: helix-turn-helix transcriptional regulator [Bacteroidetes bacterium]|nr:helix-turn-helix transcriptional regulator [Bacteroidota bacterium]